MGKLYDDRLDVFLACADTGSFAQAGNTLFMTSTGVLKQMTQLEQDLQMELFVRTHRGLKLTQAGEQLKTEVENLKVYCADLLKRVEAVRDGLNEEIRIGTSRMTPPALLADLWPKIQPLNPDLGYRFVSFDNNPQKASVILSNFGEEIDVVAGFFDDQFLEWRKCAGQKVCSCPIGFGIPFGHRLYLHENLELSDLAGETILVIQKGWSKATDKIIQKLESLEEINLEFFPFFNPESLLKAVNEEKIIMAFGLWQSQEPLLKVVEPDWTEKINYGFLHSVNPSGAVRRFLDAVAQTTE